MYSSFLISFPFAVLASLLGLILSWFDRYSELSCFLGKIPFYFGETLRYIYYKFTLESVGNKVTFKYGSFCQYRNAKIGNNVLVGYNCQLGQVETGDDILMGSNINILSGTTQHSYSDPLKKICKQQGKRETIKFGSDLWIGSNSVIANNIGNRCIIATGSIIIKEVESNTIVGGNPARLLKKIK